jgi:potassium inwardly-rectifying channel subfamily J
MTPQDLQREQFEIIVMLEGGVESTGLAAQARTSYLPNEIFWGHRFLAMTNFSEKNSEFEVDYKQFHSTYAVDTPMFSAKDLDEMANKNETDTVAQTPAVYRNGHANFAT